MDVLEKSLTHSDIATLYLTLGSPPVDTAGNKRSRIVALVSHTEKTGTEAMQELLDVFTGMIGARPSYYFDNFIQENQEFVRLIPDAGFRLPDDWLALPAAPLKESADLTFLDEVPVAKANHTPAYSDIVRQYAEAKEMDHVSELTYSGAAELSKTLGSDHVIVKDILASAGRLSDWARNAQVEQFSRESSRIGGLLRAGEALLSAQSNPPRVVTSKDQRAGIFVSHSAVDRDFAKGVVRLIEGSFNLPAPTPVRCTSLPGYSLESGVLTSEALRTDLSNAGVVIGLITPHSLKSDWVLFELGAAWGSAHWIVPLLTPDVEFTQLPGPLRERNALRCDNRDNMVQLLAELASKTKYTARTIDRSLDALNDYHEFISRVGISREG